ncbi:MAG: hypothetical protein ACEPOW_14520, partial [Bacteroidales bacterium]
MLLPASLSRFKIRVGFCRDIPRLIHPSSPNNLSSYFRKRHTFKGEMNSRWTGKRRKNQELEINVKAKSEEVEL